MYNTKLELCGNNIINFINLCRNNNIIISNILKKNQSNIVFEIDDTNLNKLKTIDLSQYSIKIIRTGGKRRLKQILLQRIGLIIGLIISLAILLFFNNRLLNIYIVGNSNISYEQIVSKLNEVGVKRFTLINYDLDEIESYLQDEFNLSMVSIINKGNSIIISIKEELPSIEDEYCPIYADEDMVIEDINIFAGTSNLKVGDIVKKGDVVIYPYIINNGVKLFVKPSARIIAETYITETYKFYINEEIYVKTGKKETINSSISIGKHKIYNNTKNAIFEFYEDVETSQEVSKYLIPITINKTIRYELRKEIIEREYIEYKDKIDQDLLNRCNNGIGNMQKVMEEKLLEIDAPFGKVINMTLICESTFDYK